MITDKVYVVVWFGAFDDWKLEKAFISEEKARDFTRENGDRFDWFEVELG